MGVGWGAEGDGFSPSLAQLSKTSLQANIYRARGRSYKNISNLERGECHVPSRVWGKSVEDLESGKREPGSKARPPPRPDPGSLGVWGGS